MKKLLVAVFAILCLTSCKSNDSTIRVGSYNLWVTHLGKENYAWDVRKERLAQSFADVNFDIVGCQEVDTLHQKELPELIRNAGGADYRWFVFSPYDTLGGVGNKAQAVLYKADRFEIEESHHFWFSETPDVISSGWDEMRFKRGGLCLKMKDKATGKEFIFMHAHMPLGQKANLHASEILIERSKMYNPENLPQFFVGDLNTRPDTPSSDLLRTHWNDSYLNCENAESGIGTFNGAVTERDMEVARRIDYIYYKGDIELKEYEVVTTKYDGYFPSDHCPLYVDAIIK